MAISKAGVRKLDELRLEALDPNFPWGGRSPRCLTEAWQRFNLQSRDDDVNEFFVWDAELIDEQNRRFFNGS